MVSASRLGPALLGLMLAITPARSIAASTCPQPGRWDVAAAFDLAGNGITRVDAQPAVTVPPSLLKATGWVESNWRQLGPAGTPLVSPDFGYGIMQVTSGMAGAFGQAGGSIPPATQSKIASDYRFNIAYGQRLLATKWAATPPIGPRDPTVIEDWYYAVWAYNGWGWVNNPNNPRFTRRGTPATQPATWPYQERVFYLLAHPPRDRAGNPLWRPMAVTLPPRGTIGTRPGPYTPTLTHRQPPASLSAVFLPARLRPALPGAAVQAKVTIVNTGIQPWVASGDNAVSVVYHLFSRQGNPWKPISPFSPGVIAYGQHPVPLPRDVLPGQRVTVTETVQAPPLPGTVRVVWDLAQAPGTLFSDMGSPPRAVAWRVRAGPGGTPPSVPTVTPTATPRPAQDLAYVADTAAPDGSQVKANTLFPKGWLVFNSGTTAWTPDWRLVRTQGRRAGRGVFPIPTTAACTSANILVTLRSPVHPGAFRSTWRLREPGGRLVGQALTVRVTVVRGGAGSPPTPRPTSNPTPIRPPQPTATPTPAG